MDPQILLQYERQWSSGDRPRLEDFLSLDLRESQGDFRDLLRCELNCRRKLGETPLPHEYEDRFPQFVAVVSDVFAERLTASDVEQPTASFHSPSTTAAGAAMPQKLGRFELKELIGRGGFGAVYRAYDTQLDREVAIKLPRAGGAIEETQLRRFLHEARAAAQLIHPNIVPVFDAGQIGDQHYIASEFIHGESLRKWLQFHSPLPFAQAAEFVATLAGALHFAHTKGIVHRDVKPDNVLVDATGKLHLTDFGLARREDELQTQDGSQLGTPAYMSPEQVSGKSHEADPRTDVWALGVILYELLAGERPFGGTVAEIYQGISKGEPRDLARHARKPPRDLITICLRCLAKSPGARFQSAAELATELRRWLAGEPILSRPASRFEKGWSWCRRNAPLAIAGSVALVAVASILIGGAGFGFYRQWATKSLAAAQEEITSKEATAEKAEVRATEEEQAKTEELVESDLDTGVEYCRTGDVSRGLFYLVRSLERGAELPKNRLEAAARLNLVAWSRQLPVLKQQFAIEQGSQAELAPDGITMIVRQGDTVARYDLTTGRPIGKPLKVARVPWHTKVTVDNLLLCTYHEPIPPAVDVWDLTSNTERELKFKLPFEQVRDAIISLPAQRLAVIDMQGKVHLFALDQGGAIAEDLGANVGEAFRIELMPNGRQFVTVHRDARFFTWNLEDGKSDSPSFQLKSHPNEIKFDASGRFMLVASGNQRMTVLDLEFLKDVNQSLEIQPAKGPYLIAFSGNGRRAAMVDRELLRFYHFTGRSKYGLVLRNAEQVVGVGIHPDGQFLFALDQAARVQVWNLPGAPTAKVFHHPYFIHDLAVGADSKRLAAAGGGGFSLFRLDASEGGEFFEHDSNASNIRISRHDQRIVVRRQGAEVTLAGSGHRVVDSFVPFSPFGMKLYSADEHLLIRRENPGGFEGPTSIESWDVSTEQRIARLEAQPHGYLDMALSPDDRFLALACNDGFVRVLDSRTLQPKLDPLPCGQIATALAWSGDGKILTGGSREGLVHVWRIPEGKLEIAETLDGAIAALHLSHDGGTLLAQASNVAGVFDCRDKMRLKGLIQHQAIQRTALSPDGEFCVTNSADGLAQLWHTHSLRTVGPFTQSEERISAVKFLPNGREWAWADNNGKVSVQALPEPTLAEPEELLACLQTATGMQMSENMLLKGLPAADWKKLRTAWEQRAWPLAELRQTAQLEIKRLNIPVFNLPPRVLPESAGEHTEVARLVSELGAIVDANSETIYSISFHRTTNVPDRALLARIGQLPSLRSLNLGVLSIKDEDIALLKNCSQLRSLVIHCPELTDRGLKQITVSFPRLGNLRLDHPRITDEGTGALAALSQLEGLGISQTPITDWALKHLVQSPLLRQLYLTDTKISHSAAQTLKLERPALQVFHSNSKEAQAKPLAAPTPPAANPGVPTPAVAKPATKPETARQLEALGGRVIMHGDAIVDISFFQVAKHPDRDLIRKIGELKSLTSLHLGITPCTDDDAATLAGCAALTNLVVIGPGITDRGLESLAKLKNLEHLRLAESKITDEGLAVLSSLEKLRVLGLTKCEITDAAAVQLQLLPKIEQLYVNETKVTVQGVNKIKIMKPKLQIFPPQGAK